MFDRIFESFFLVDLAAAAAAPIQTMPVAAAAAAPEVPQAKAEGSEEKKHKKKHKKRSSKHSHADGQKTSDGERAAAEDQRFVNPSLIIFSICRIARLDLLLLLLNLFKHMLHLNNNSNNNNNNNKWRFVILRVTLRKCDSNRNDLNIDV